MAATDSGPPVLRSLSCVGPRSRELTGAEDLAIHYGLQDLYEQFCKKPLSVPVVDSPYLQHVVGDIEIRKGEGMEFGQITGASSNRVVNMQTLDVQLLQWAFTLRENGTITLLEADKGQPTTTGNAKGYKDKKRKKKHKKHKHRERDKLKSKDKDKDQGRGEIDEDGSKKHRKKKRRCEGAGEEAEGHRHRKKKVAQGSVFV